MNFQPRTSMLRALLLLSITGVGTFTAPATFAGPQLNRFQQADPMAVPAPADSLTTFLAATVKPSEAAVALPASSLPAAKPMVVIPSRPSLAERMRDQAGSVVSTALNFIGMPYRHGGSSESTGFDCSGFTRYMFEMSAGLVLPRAADQQAKAPGLASVKRDELQPGDLVFFNTLRRTFSHVGIYIGEGKFIHAPKPGAEVRVEDMGVAYWARRFTGARRADPDVDPMVGPAPDVAQTSIAAGPAMNISASLSSSSLPTALAAAPVVQAATLSRSVAARHKAPVRRPVRRHHR